MRFAALTVLVALTAAATANDERRLSLDTVTASNSSSVIASNGSKASKKATTDGQTVVGSDASTQTGLSLDTVTASNASSAISGTSNKASKKATTDEQAVVVSGVTTKTRGPTVADGTDTVEKMISAADKLTMELDSFCHRIDAKLSSVDHAECMRIGLLYDGADSNKATPLLFKDFGAVDDPSAVRVLLIGGVHGDEYSSVSIVFKWLAMLEDDLGDHFNWRIIPVLNPDGLLRPPRMSQRMNANGVDLNRNFPTPNWEDEAHAYWVKNARKNKRRYPGPSPLSEPEAAWLVEQIESFQPHAVVSVHAPHGVVDFDGPRVPPRQLGPLELRLLGTYPGSMGRYIGIHKGIPLLTLELESAFGMPAQDEVYDIWYDMIGWLHEKIAIPLKLAQDKAEVPATDVIRIRARPDEG